MKWLLHCILVSSALFIFRFVACFVVAGVSIVPGQTAFLPTEHWSQDIFVVPEYSFAVDVGDRELALSSEHDKVRWVSYNKAVSLLTWDSNRFARISETRNTKRM